MNFTLKRWNFPSNQNGALSGIGNSGIETFKGTRIKSLAREICQNSIDANLDDSQPTRIQFSLFEIPVSAIPDADGLTHVLKKAKDFWSIQESKKATDFFDSALQTMSNESIVCLRISDFNTSGLMGAKESYNSPWCNLIKSDGASDKIGSNGGSFGIGKFAPYACSSLRTLFYSTHDSSGEEAYQGVSRLTSFKDDDGDVKQSTGFYGNNLNTPVFEQFSLDPNFNRGKESGTDVFLLGFMAEENWKEKMVASILDGFLYAVFSGKLVVDVDGIEISRDTLADTVVKYKPYFEENADNYYKALTATEDASEFSDDILSMGKVTLRILIQRDMHRRVAMVRKTGMKIMDKGHINGFIPFSGVLYIEGDELNSYLRSLENPQHTKWEDDRADDPKEAKRVKLALTRFIKECLDKLKNESSDEELNPSVGEYLTAEQEEGAPEERSENLNDNIKEFQKREVKIRKPKADEFNIPGEGSAELDDDEGDITVDDIPGTGSPSGDGKRKNGTGGGGSGIGDGTGNTPTEHKKSQAGIAPSKLRIMSSAGENSCYVISFTPSASARNASLAVFLSAESDRYEASIDSAELVGTGEPLSVEGNRILGLSFDENVSLKIKVRINYSDYCSMEVRAYGYKI